MYFNVNGSMSTPKYFGVFEKHAKVTKIAYHRPFVLEFSHGMNGICELYYLSSLAEPVTICQIDNISSFTIVSISKSSKKTADGLFYVYIFLYRLDIVNQLVLMGIPYSSVDSLSLLGLKCNVSGIFKGVNSSKVLTFIPTTSCYELFREKISSYKFQNPELYIEKHQCCSRLGSFRTKIHSTCLSPSAPSEPLNNQSNSSVNENSRNNESEINKEGQKVSKFESTQNPSVIGQSPPRIISLLSPMCSPRSSLPSNNTVSPVSRNGANVRRTVNFLHPSSIHTSSFDSNNTNMNITNEEYMNTEKHNNNLEAIYSKPQMQIHTTLIGSNELNKLNNTILEQKTDHVDNTVFDRDNIATPSLSSMTSSHVTSNIHEIRKESESENERYERQHGWSIDENGKNKNHITPSGNIPHNSTLKHKTPRKKPHSNKISKPSNSLDEEEIIIKDEFNNFSSNSTNFPSNQPSSSSCIKTPDLPPIRPLSSASAPSLDTIFITPTVKSTIDPQVMLLAKKDVNDLLQSFIQSFLPSTNSSEQEATPGDGIDNFTSHFRRFNFVWSIVIFLLKLVEFIVMMYSSLRNLFRSIEVGKSARVRILKYFIVLLKTFGNVDSTASQGADDSDLRRDQQYISTLKKKHYHFDERLIFVLKSRILEESDGASLQSGLLSQRSTSNSFGNSKQRRMISNSEQTIFRPWIALSSEELSLINGSSSIRTLRSVFLLFSSWAFLFFGRFIVKPFSEFILVDSSSHSSISPSLNNIVSILLPSSFVNQTNSTGEIYLSDSLINNHNNFLNSTSTLSSFDQHSSGTILNLTNVVDNIGCSRANINETSCLPSPLQKLNSTFQQSSDSVWPFQFPDVTFPSFNPFPSFWPKFLPNYFSILLVFGYTTIILLCLLVLSHIQMLVATCVFFREPIIDSSKEVRQGIHFVNLPLSVKDSNASANEDINSINVESNRDPPVVEGGVSSSSSSYRKNIEYGFPNNAIMPLFVDASSTFLIQDEENDSLICRQRLPSDPRNEKEEVRPKPEIAQRQLSIVPEAIPSLSSSNRDLNSSSYTPQRTTATNIIVHSSITPLKNSFQNITSSRHLFSTSPQALGDVFSFPLRFDFNEENKNLILPIDSNEQNKNWIHSSAGNNDSSNSNHSQLHSPVRVLPKSFIFKHESPEHSSIRSSLSSSQSIVLAMSPASSKRDLPPDLVPETVSNFHGHEENENPTKLSLKRFLTSDTVYDTFSVMKIDDNNNNYNSDLSDNEDEFFFNSTEDYPRVKSRGSVCSTSTVLINNSPRSFRRTIETKPRDLPISKHNLGHNLHQNAQSGIDSTITQLQVAADDASRALSNACKQQIGSNQFHSSFLPEHQNFITNFKSDVSTSAHVHSPNGVSNLLTPQISQYQNASVTQFQQPTSSRLLSNLNTPMISTHSQLSPHFPSSRASSSPDFFQRAHHRRNLSRVPPPFASYQNSSIMDQELARQNSEQRLSCLLDEVAAEDDGGDIPVSRDEEKKKIFHFFSSFFTNKRQHTTFISFCVCALLESSYTYTTRLMSWLPSPVTATLQFMCLLLLRIVIIIFLHLLRLAPSNPFIKFYMSPPTYLPPPDIKKLLSLLPPPSPPTHPLAALLSRLFVKFWAPPSPTSSLDLGNCPPHVEAISFVPYTPLFTSQLHNLNQQQFTQTHLNLNVPIHMHISAHWESSNVSPMAFGWKIPFHIIFPLIKLTISTAANLTPRSAVRANANDRHLFSISSELRSIPYVLPISSVLLIPATLLSPLIMLLSIAAKKCMSPPTLCYPLDPYVAPADTANSVRTTIAVSLIDLKYTTEHIMPRVSRLRIRVSLTFDPANFCAVSAPFTLISRPQFASILRVPFKPSFLLPQNLPSSARILIEVLAPPTIGSQHDPLTCPQLLAAASISISDIIRIGVQSFTTHRLPLASICPSFISGVSMSLTANATVASTSAFGGPFIDGMASNIANIDSTSSGSTRIKSMPGVDSNNQNLHGPFALISGIRPATSQFLSAIANMKNNNFKDSKVLLAEKDATQDGDIGRLPSMSPLLPLSSLPHQSASSPTVVIKIFSAVSLPRNITQQATTHHDNFSITALRCRLNLTFPHASYVERISSLGRPYSVAAKSVNDHQQHPFKNNLYDNQTQFPPPTYLSSKNLHVHDEWEVSWKEKFYFPLPGGANALQNFVEKSALHLIIRPDGVVDPCWGGMFQITHIFDSAALFSLKEPSSSAMTRSLPSPRKETVGCTLLLSPVLKDNQIQLYNQSLLERETPYNEVPTWSKTFGKEFDIDHAHTKNLYRSRTSGTKRRNQIQMNLGQNPTFSWKDVDLKIRIEIEVNVPT